MAISGNLQGCVQGQQGTESGSFAPSDPVPLSRLATEIMCWLQHGHGDLRPLVDWLEGYGYPAGTLQAEPYVRLFSAVDELAPGWQESFAERVKALLLSEPDVNPFGDRPSEVVYNLLKLCSVLSSGGVLAGPLEAMMKRGRLSGEFDGASLRDQLTDALIYNQADNRFLDIWNRKLDGDSSGFLPGGVLEGLDGIAEMPSEADPDRPDMSALGRALGVFARYLGERVDRRKMFDRYLVGLASRTDSGIWNEFPAMADRYQWPDWARSTALHMPEIDPPGRPPDPSPFEFAKNELRLTNGARPEEVALVVRELESEKKKLAASGTPRDRVVGENQFLIGLERSYRHRRFHPIADAIGRARSKSYQERKIPAVAP